MSLDMDRFSRGFDAGNYANAYESTDLEEAWTATVAQLRDEDERFEDSADPSAHEGFRAGFVVGFFSSYEDDEIGNEEEREERIEAARVWGERAKAYGIAID